MYSCMLAGSQAVNPVNRVHKAITKTKPGLSISQAAQKYLETHNSPWQNAQFLEQASSHKQQMSKNPGPEIVPDILNHVIQPNTHRLAQRGHSEKNVLQSQTIQLDSSSEEEGENSREGKPSRESAMTSLWSLRTSPDVQMCVSSTTKAKDEKASGSSTDVEMVLNGAGQQTHLVQKWDAFANSCMLTAQSSSSLVSWIHQGYYLCVLKILQLLSSAGQYDSKGCLWCQDNAFASSAFLSLRFAIDALKMNTNLASYPQYSSIISCY